MIDIRVGHLRELCTAILNRYPNESHLDFCAGICWPFAQLGNDAIVPFSMEMLEIVKSIILGGS